ncbi:hypothetical protein J3F84DRAFT_369603 [Trichoderma pleuroticola]
MATAPSDLLHATTPRRCDTQPTLQTPSSTLCRMGVPIPDVQLHRGGPCCAESANPTPAIGRLTVLLCFPSLSTKSGKPAFRLAVSVSLIVARLGSRVLRPGSLPRVAACCCWRRLSSPARLSVCLSDPT